MVDMGGHSAYPLPVAPSIDYEKLNDEQKIDYQLAQMNQPKIIYRDSYRSRKSNDGDLSLMGGLIIGGMLF